ncbi:MAG: alpha-amylase family glycosyl hydrolase [Pseudonocardiales bacterium]|nr:alpha-amylase family glycosyl hydrolase [Pseudonocardiales bacterium]
MRAPSSTYRLQFSSGTTFDDAIGLLPYLDALGVGALYASPLLESGAGSNHGYDVVDPTRTSDERGGDDRRSALVAAVREHGLRFVLDIVPNHVGVDVAKANPWWWDVLRLGRSSEHAATFDVDWDAGPILLPILDADEEKALAELSVDGDELRYYEHAFPVAPGTGGGTAQEVHERQHYRLVSWKRGAAELTYRRFFDVSTLAAVRVEIPEIFEKTHAEVLRWVAAGEVDGIRVDHPDGLSDPGGYARMLRAAIGPDRWLLVEKILAAGEELPVSWPVDGTSGYEALREVQGVFVDPDGAGLITQIAAEHTGTRQSLHAAEHDARREVASTILAASGMVMAKGVEDTAFYRWNRFVALNEVGGDPSEFGIVPAEFHRLQAVRAASWPETMTTLSTHDTKRSEDVRARLAVLAEIPGEWAPRFRRWAARHPLPDRSLELLAWQNLVGAWPIPADRMAAYLGKASKEAKLVTSHVDAVAEVDEAVAAWPAAVLGDADLVAEIEEFVARIAGPGWSNSLGQKLLQLAGPGVPDVYQGTELFEYSLVDPDNRRPVDWAARRALLARLDDGWLPDVDAEGAAKLLVTAATLRLRRYRPEVFAGYRPVPAGGPAAEHVVAFARSESLVAVATRLPVGLAGVGWGDTVLPLPDGSADWHDVITDTAVDGSAPLVGDLLSRYPVALLVRPA